MKDSLHVKNIFSYPSLQTLDISVLHALQQDYYLHMPWVGKKMLLEHGGALAAEYFAIAIWSTENDEWHKKTISSIKGFISILEVPSWQDEPGLAMLNFFHKGRSMIDIHLMGRQNEGIKG